MQYMQNLLSPKQIKEQLHQTLGDLGNFKQYALLDYPNHSNLGDHLIWLGELFYVNHVLKAKIGYASHLKNFSGEMMEKQVGKSPILLHGGGNLGDLWTYYQKFREQIISTYLDRPIFILPQTLYFAEERNLENTAKIFNAHPNLTIFVRDNYSYKIANEAFDNCKVIKAPDMAFQMVDMPNLSFNLNHKDSILYLKRKDKELNNLASLNSLEFNELSIKDWESYTYYWKYRTTSMPRAWTPQGIIRVLREGWQQGTYIPLEWFSRQKWNFFHPYCFCLRKMSAQNLHLKSWNMMHHGIYQLKQYPLAITNRLHGHILSLLLGIPHVFLANSYYKNEAFYETWTAQIPFCKFVKDISQVETAVQELLTTFGAKKA
ncbi:MAG: polysaccharide pyruvyl transferase family protein [Hydrococcus sp. Prado102]|jgi:pyruvyl transferase EpsO|nr:polysaccharide pyruvyl transferase family protein [Hydrococcus sp. Prado102]